MSHGLFGRDVPAQASEVSEVQLSSSSRTASNSPYASIWSRSRSTNFVPPARDQTSEQRKKKTKRSHTKSRQGCYNCKIRRIKCQETLPSCENCLKKGGTCKYPVPSKPIQQLYEELSILHEPQSLPPLFTIHDMRLMAHFILDAHPHLPLDHEAVWSREIPAFAQGYDFLMHAMLALSASHLALATNTDISGPAIAHRQIALQGLNKALSAPLKANDAHAMLATCFALTFQSSYMADGFAEFITMVRGCALITMMIVSNNLAGPFVFSELHNARMVSKLDSFTTIDARLVDAAVMSLQRLQATSEVEEMYHKLLLNTIRPLKTSPKEGYLNFTKVFEVFTTLPQSAIDALVDPRNQTAQTLHAHFIAIQFCLAPLSVSEGENRVMRIPIGAMLTWIENMNQNVSSEMQTFMEWPMKMVRAGRRYAGPKALMNGNIVDFIMDQPDVLYEEMMA